MFLYLCGHNSHYLSNDLEKFTFLKSTYFYIFCFSFSFSSILDTDWQFILV